MGDEQINYRDFGDSRSGVYPPEDFEGLWVEHWPNGQLKFRGQYKKGEMRVGQHMSFYENGVLDEISSWSEGWMHGTVLWFREDGSKEREKDYGEAGGTTQSWTERWYGLDSDLWKVEIYKDGKVVSEWTHPEVREIWKTIDADKIVQDAVRMVYPDVEEKDRVTDEQ
jgi:hypothetical protein